MKVRCSSAGHLSDEAERRRRTATDISSACPQATASRWEIPLYGHTWRCYTSERESSAPWQPDSIFPDDVASGTFHDRSDAESCQRGTPEICHCIVLSPSTYILSPSFTLDVEANAITDNTVLQRLRHELYFHL